MSTNDQKDDNKTAPENTSQDSAQNSGDNTEPKAAGNSADTKSETKAASQEETPNFTWSGVIFLVVLIGIGYLMFKYIKI